MKFVKLSDFATADSDVINGGGTNCTEKIQTVLDMAKEGGGLFVTVDGGFLTETLTVYSHTTLFCPNEACGFYLKDDTNAPLIRNAHFSQGEREDRDISLIGGTYNFNCRHQLHDRGEIDSDDPVIRFTHSWVFGMMFYGVYSLKVQGAVFRNQRTFAFVCGNAEQVAMENIRIDLPDIMNAQNQDGLHFFGPSKNIVLRNISGTAGDDFIALAPDEFDAKSYITDVLIDGVHLNNSDQGIRLLCRGKGLLDRIIIRNVTGTYKCFGFYINPWASPEYKEGERYGNYGSVTIENVDLKQTELKYPYTKAFLFRLGGIIEYRKDIRRKLRECRGRSRFYADRRRLHVFRRKGRRLQDNDRKSSRRERYRVFGLSYGRNRGQILRDRQYDGEKRKCGNRKSERNDQKFESKTVAGKRLSVTTFVLSG